ncbi:hypothetical protein Mgra_00007642 [Meloidogyne graminicola]|uniref:BolA-like protein n=1 Tax=Meloidogyne graminicola TaxID=189291 RepID=A0A8S9ZI41_9BILA|nr:hypothetical protein Mgra_00007642 [Meloidogyne graminicola]
MSFYLNVKIKLTILKINKYYLMIARLVTSKRMYSNIDNSMQGSLTSIIKNKLTEFFKPQHIQVECESQFHNVPKGTEKHFRVQICSDKFNGLTQIQRHKIVFNILSEEMQNQIIHALRIEAKTPNEWDGQEQEKAPPCLGRGKSLK